MVMAPGGNLPGNTPGSLSPNDQSNSVSTFGRLTVIPGPLIASSIYPPTGSPLYFGTFGTPNVWTIDGGGHFYCAADMFKDIGAMSIRIRNVYVGGAIATGIKAGIPVDGDVTNPFDGMIRIDSTNSRIYVRVGGVWKYAALT
jgi:hypothetical protein